jgi:uncharacterized small protein (DUF1192 family)
MPTSADYERKAKECREHAGQAHHAIEREPLLNMAELWDRLADLRARIERQPALRLVDD